MSTTADLRFSSKDGQTWTRKLHGNERLAACLA
jgi:hypothetical protein